MKRLAALFMVLVMLSALPAFADDAGYLRQLPQYVYSLTTVLTPESYPEVYIAPYYAYRFFTSYDPAEPLFLSFPLPDGAQAESFDSNSVHCLDVNNAIQYIYTVKASDSWEEFINEAEKDEYIILDGSDGLAAYLNPSKLSAYGMIATREFGKSSKLVITIRMDGLSTKMPEDTIIAALSEAITNELERVKAGMHYETKDSYWNNGEYAGVKLLDKYEFAYLTRLDFPELKYAFSDGSSGKARMIITSMDGSNVEGFYSFASGQYINVEIEINSYSYPVSKLEDKDPDVQEVNFQNGHKWIVYASGLTEYGKTSYTYAAIQLQQKRWDSTCYLTLHFDAEGDIEWNSLEEFLDVLVLFDNFEEISPDQDPYVPAAKAEVPTPADIPSPADEPAPATDDGSWKCPECETINTGKYCSECGTKKPEADTQAPVGTPDTADAADTAEVAVFDDFEYVYGGVGYELDKRSQLVGGYANLSYIRKDLDMCIQFTLRGKADSAAPRLISIEAPNGKVVEWKDVEFSSRGTSTFSCLFTGEAEGIAEGTYRVLCDGQLVASFPVKVTGVKGSAFHNETPPSDIVILYGGIAYQGSDRRSCNVQGTNYLSAAEKGYDQYYISFSVRGISSDPQPHIFKLICENDGRVMMESREPETISSGSTSTINCTVDLEKIPGDYTLYIDDVPAYRFSTAVE